MDLSALFQRAGQAAAKNSPAILTAIGVTGTLTTAYLAAKAGFKSAAVIADAEENGTLPHPETGEDIPVKFDELKFQQKFELLWELYVPAATCATLTIAAIICSNRVSERRAAALASAYTLAEKNFKSYREKTLKKVGKKKEQEIRDDIATDEVNKKPPSKSKITVVGNFETLVLDQYSGRYFTGDIEKIRSAVNDFNAMVINDNYGSLTEFYELIGLDATSVSGDFGWTTDKLLEVNYSWTTWNGDPLLCIDFISRPVSKYDTIF